MKETKLQKTEELYMHYETKENKSKIILKFLKYFLLQQIFQCKFQYQEFRSFSCQKFQFQYQYVSFVSSSVVSLASSFSNSISNSVVSFK